MTNLDDAIRAAADDMGFDNGAELLEFLGGQGLTVCTTQGRAVLDAMAVASIETYDGGYVLTDPHDVCAAELARREAAK